MSRSQKVRRLLGLLTTLWCVSLSAQEPASEKAFNEVRQLYQDGKTTEALAALQQYEKQYPLSAFVPQAIYLQGWCESDLHKYREATDTFNQLIRSYPTCAVIPNALLKSAECYRELKDYPVALARYTEFETQYPDHKLLPQARLGEAWTHLQQGDLQTARAVAQKVPDDLPGASFLSGEILIAEGKYDEADKVFQRIPTQKENARDFYFAGEAMFSAKQYAYALACYERAESATDLRALVLFRIADCQQLLGHLPEATKACRQWLKAYPDDLHAEQARFALIQLLVEQHEMAEANKECTAFQNQYPRSRFHTDVLFLQAETLFAADQFQSALDHYQKFSILNKSPRLAETANFRIAACYAGLHDFNRAQGGFTAFLKKYPQSELTADALFHLAHCDAAQTNFSSAVSNYELIRTRFPDYGLMSEVIFQLGSLYTSPGTEARDKSVARLQEFVSRWPDTPLVPDALYQLAQNQVAQSQFADAIATYQRLIEKYPRHKLAPLAVDEIAATYRKMNRSDTAFMALDPLTEQPHAKVRIAAITSLLELALDEKDADRSKLLAYKLVLDSEVDRLPTRSYLAAGKALLEHDDFSRARDVYQKCLARYPDDPQTKRLALLGFARASLALKHLNDAEKGFDQVLAADPHDVEAELGLAKTYLALDRESAKTVELLNQVLANSTGESNGEAAFLLGNYFFKLPDSAGENKHTALAYYLRASVLTSGSDGEEAAFRTGQCHKALGNAKAARNAFEAYLRRFPNGKRADDAKQELAAL